MIGDNTLPTLAERIRLEHNAAADALTAGIKHAMAAGDALLEAKAIVPHGQWLPWLAVNCEMSERTAQLYMRVAKNRDAIEMRIRNGVADLTMNEAAALVFLTSDVKRILDFAAKLQEVGEPEDVLKICLENDVRLFRDQHYDVWHGCNDEQKREWTLYILFLVTVAGYSIESAEWSVEWLRQRPFVSVGEWLNEEGAEFRRRCRMRRTPSEHVEVWREFSNSRSGLSLENIDAELMAAKAPAPSLSTVTKKQSRRPRSGGRP